MFNQTLISKWITFQIENLAVMFILYGPWLCLISLFYYLTMYNNLYARILFTLYFIYMIYHYNTSIKKGKNGPGSSILKKILINKFVRNYFTAKLIKTSDLPPNRNYLFAAFPHGGICTGIIVNLISKYSNFEQLFPGIQIRLCTLNMNYFGPVLREFNLAFGCTSVSENSIKTLLTASKFRDKFTSNAVVILVGGMKEIPMSWPNNNQIKLLSRKGFVRVAIMTGAPIVPVYTFGEVDLWEQPMWLKSFLKKYANLDITLFYGKGPFFKKIGILPHRRPITTVVGAPIEVVKNMTPTPEEIDKVHKKFIEALIELFDTHKEKYIPNGKDAKLIIS